MTDQDKTPEQIRPGMTEDAAPQTPPAQPGKNGESFTGDDDPGEKALRTTMDEARPRDPEDIGEEIAEEVTQDGADEISQSATGGLGITDVPDTPR